MNLQDLVEEKFDNNEKIGLKLQKSLSYQMIKAITCVHDQKICHRDLKPDNILLQKNGKNKMTSSD